MVKVRMNVSIASAEWSYSPKQEIDLDLELANAWQEAGHCEIVGSREEYPQEEGVIDGSPQVDNSTGKRTNKSK